MTVDVDPAALGHPLTAIVRVRPAPQQLHKVVELARATPEVGSATASPGQTASR